MIKDCHERKSFASEDNVWAYQKWEKVNLHRISVRFRCRRCGHWHIVGSREEAGKVQRFLTPVRCVTDRELHLQMARVVGCSLDELQTRVDLSKIKVTGPGFEVVKVRPEKKPWDS